MGDQIYFAKCNTVPTVQGSEVRFSFKQEKLTPVGNLPFKYVTCDELTPPQSRSQWGVLTEGARADQYQGLRVGSEKTYVEVGSRSTYAQKGSILKDVETQRVGVVTGSVPLRRIGLDGTFRISYWNDHAFSFWKPIGSGVPTFEKLLNKEPDLQWDYGDTAGVKLTYDLNGRGIPISSVDPWFLNNISLTMRLATGIPDAASVVDRNGEKFYSRIEFESVDRGDLNLNAGFSKNAKRLDVGIVLNSGAVRHMVQSKFVHKTLVDAPQLPLTRTEEVYFYIRLSGF